MVDRSGLVERFRKSPSVLAEIALRDSLREKETLLREVHHRVKNNLQIISSLLYFQGRKVKDPTALAVFGEAADRVRSMVLVHEKLYQSGSLSRIDMGDYVQTLVRELEESYASKSQRFQVGVTADKIYLPIELVLPCGMIVCELVTNAFKYAFPEGKTGNVEVKIARVDDRIELTVSDAGVGLPVDFSPAESAAFGWQLVQNLTNQLGGKVLVGAGPGTRVVISFPGELSP